MSGLWHRKKPRSLQLWDESILCVPPFSGTHSENMSVCKHWCLSALLLNQWSFWGHNCIKYTRGVYVYDINHITIMRFSLEYPVCHRAQDLVYRCTRLVCCLVHTGGTYRWSSGARWSSGTHRALMGRDKRYNFRLTTNNHILYQYTLLKVYNHIKQIIYLNFLQVWM